MFVALVSVLSLIIILLHGLQVKCHDLVPLLVTWEGERSKPRPLFLAEMVAVAVHLPEGLREEGRSAAAVGVGVREEVREGRRGRANGIEG